MLPIGNLLWCLRTAIYTVGTLESLRPLRVCPAASSLSHRYAQTMLTLMLLRRTANSCSHCRAAPPHSSSHPPGKHCSHMDCALWYGSMILTLLFLLHRG